MVLIVEQTGQPGHSNDISKPALIQDIKGRGGCTEGEHIKLFGGTMYASTRGGNIVDTLIYIALLFVHL